VKQILALALCLLLLFHAIPARADFKYTDTSKITGGSLKNMVKFAGIFNKQASQSLKAMSTTRYVKGNVMRTDHSDGSIQILDVNRRVVIEMDPQNRTYSEMTFDEIRDALQKATEQQKAKMQKDPKTKDAQVDMKAKISTTPGETGRIVNGQTTNEMKMQIDMEFTAQQQPDAQNTSQTPPSGPASGTMSTSIDSWIAPSVSGYDEVTELYKKLAKELNWIPPSGITVNPQVSQSMQEMQKNQALYKGLPILQYISMSMAGSQGATSSDAKETSSSSSSSSPPTNPSEAVMKGLGGLFGKKKKNDAKGDSSTGPGSGASGSAALNPPPPPSVPGALMEMTIEVSAFSDSALDPALFTVPAEYKKVANDPNHVLGKSGKQ
jgi:hypothetical protein